MHYAGETSRALKRMHEHKASVQKYGQIKSASRHFKSVGHNHRDIQFSVLESCTPRSDPINTAQEK